MKTNRTFDDYCKENVIVNFEGDRHVFTEGISFTSSSSTFSEGDRKVVEKETEKGRDITIINSQSGIAVTQHYAFYGEAVRQYNEIRNTAEDEKLLINATSAVFAFPYKGIIPWNDERRFRLHVCKTAWSAEAQWHTGSLTDFGLTPIRLLEKGMQGPGRIRIAGQGSWSTGRYYPLVILEDMEKGEAFFMEHEGGLSWEITIGFEGDRLALSCGSANIHMDGFCKRLSGQESFVTTSAVYGKVQGGFEEAVAELTKYKRAASARTWQNGIPPVCYNPFMGGIYGKPNEQNMKKLIPAAAKLGCEIFCIDAGWFHEPEEETVLGDYVPCDPLFGREGLAGIIAMIRENGMLPGLWFELEAAGEVSDGAKQGEDTMLRRNGKIVSAERGFFDLENPGVREHLLHAVDRVYRLGVRYIKNDYNNSTGIGTGSFPANYNENERRRDKAVCDLIDELYKRYPDIIIENCGSGGMREDNGTLSHYHLQSTSDQEMYYNYASIAAATNALMPPEKAGNWANPYFLGEREYEEFDRGHDTERLIEKNRDGEATIFSMVNGMAGVPIMSGRIDYLDERNLVLTKEAVDCYKRIREEIPRLYAVYPTGMELIGNRAYITMGLGNEEKNRLYLFVWKVNAREEEVTIDLSRYIKEGAEATMLYPEQDDRCSFYYADAVRRLTVKMDFCKYMARVFCLQSRP